MLVLLLVATHGYFHQGSCWNQNAHFNLARSIVERGVIDIDSYHENTGDKARRLEHFYSNKAPGLAFLAVPVVALTNWTLPLWGEQIGTPRAKAVALQLAMVFCIALPTALAAVSLAWIASALGASAMGGMIAALAFAFGTPAFVYAGLFWSHMLCASLLTFAFAAAVGLTTIRTSKETKLLALALGMSAGLAVLSEYQAVPAAALIAALALWNVSGRKGKERKLIGSAGLMLLGALPWMILLLIYQALAFGSPFAVSYTFESTYDISSGFMGVGVPQLEVLGELLFGKFRGLLPLAPVLLLTPLGFSLLWQRNSGRLACVAVALLIVIYYFLLHASYVYWHAGWTFGPRYLSPCLPFLCLGLAPLWTWWRPHLVRPLIIILIVAGALFAFMALATKPQIPNYAPGHEAACLKPLTDIVWPMFRDGKIGAYGFWESDFGPAERFASDEAPWNIGHLMGLAGFKSLIPLAAFWLGMICFWIGLVRKTQHDQRKRS